MLLPPRPDASLRRALRVLPRVMRGVARRTTALLVLACLAITGAETFAADLADAQAMAVAAAPSGIVGHRGTSLAAAATAPATAVVLTAATVRSGRGIPARGDDDGDGPPHCNCPCHGGCPCALLHAAALPATSTPVPSATTRAASPRRSARADLAPREPAREPALRPPIA